MHKAVPVMLQSVNMCLLLLQLLLPRACLLLLLPANANIRLTEAFVLLPSASFTVALFLRDADAAHFHLCSDAISTIHCCTTAAAAAAAS